MGLPPSITARLRLPLVAAPMFQVSGPELVPAACRAGVVGAFPAANCRSLPELEGWLPGSTTSSPAGARAAVPERDRASRRRDGARRVHLQPPGRDGHHERRVAGAGGRAAARRRGHGPRRRGAPSTTPGGPSMPARTAWCCSPPGAGGDRLGERLRVRRRGALVLRRAIVLAGGVADGHALLARRVLGCDLAYMGTRFIATAESMAAPGYREMLVASELDDVLLTSAMSGLPSSILRPSLSPPASIPTTSPTGMAADTRRPLRQRRPRPARVARHLERRPLAVRRPRRADGRDACRRVACQFARAARAAVPADAQARSAASAAA